MPVERYFDLSATHMRMLSPITGDELLRIGAMASVKPGCTALDVACGKGELLCQWARHHGALGVGVDKSEVYVSAGRDRAAELEVADAVRFEVADAEGFLERTAGATYDVVSCIGGCRYLGQLGPAVRRLRECVTPDGLLVIGEPYWIWPPPAEAYQAVQATRDEYVSLPGTVDRLQRAGLEVIDMLVSVASSYDRVWTPQWRFMTEWLVNHPDDPDAPVFWQILDGTRRAYLTWGRDYFGFATFTCRISRR